MAHGRVVVRVPPEHQHGSVHHDRRVQVAEETTVLQDRPGGTHETSAHTHTHHHIHIRPSWRNTHTHETLSPLAAVHLVLVQVSGQSILVGAEGLVAPVDVDGPGQGVVHAAVAVPPLDQRPVRAHHAPHVLICGGGRVEVGRWSGGCVEAWMKWRLRGRGGGGVEVVDVEVWMKWRRWGRAGGGVEVVDEVAVERGEVLGLEVEEV